MEDRYLFRGKRIDNGEWVVGNRIDAPDGRVAIAETSGDWTGFYECIPSTICQCTGLKDKDGKLIWENDIVKYSIYQRTEHLYEIIYDCEEGSWTFGLKDVPLYSIGGANSEKCEVVGNAFDNPELLEVQE